MHARLAGDVDQFLRRGQDVVGLAALVHHEDAAVAGRDLAQFDDLVGIAEGAGHVDEAGGETKGAGGQLAVEDLAHAGHFFLGRRAAVEAHRLHAHVAVRHEVGEVGRRAVGGEQRQVAVGVAVLPVDEVGIAVEAGDVLAPGRDVLLGQGRQGHPVLAEQFGGDALADLGRERRIDDRRQVRVGMGVDEARAHDALARIIDLRAGFALEAADPGDDAVLDEDVGDEGGCPAAVDDFAAFENGSHSNLPLSNRYYRCLNRMRALPG